MLLVVGWIQCAVAFVSFISPFSGSSWLHAIAFFRLIKNRIKKCEAQTMSLDFSFCFESDCCFICEWANTHSTHFAKHSLSHSISRSLPLQMVRYLVETNRVGRAPATERQRKKMQNYGATRNSIDFVSWIQICTLNKLVVNVNIDNKWLKCLRNCDKNGIVANVRSERCTQKNDISI